MRAGLGPSIVGVVIGTAAAAALTQLLQPLLFSIDPIDLPTFGAMAALLLTAAAIAAWAPARRATRIDPAPQPSSAIVTGRPNPAPGDPAVRLAVAIVRSANRGRGPWPGSRDNGFEFVTLHIKRARGGLLSTVA